MSWSLLFCILIAIFIPSAFDSEEMGRYTYGFPFDFLTIYQHEPNSIWFFDNFFNGNVGVAIHPISLLLNVVISYVIISFLVKKRAKRRDLDLNIS